jgi:hypothetical protein
MLMLMLLLGLEHWSCPHPRLSDCRVLIPRLSDCLCLAPWPFAGSASFRALDLIASARERLRIRAIGLDWLRLPTAVGKGRGGWYVGS